MSVSRWFRDQLVANGHDPLIFNTVLNSRPNHHDGGQPAPKSVWDISDDENDDFVRYMHECTKQRPQRVSVDMNVPNGVRPNAIHYWRLANGDDSGKEEENASDNDLVWREYPIGRPPPSLEKLQNNEPPRRFVADDSRPNPTRPSCSYGLEPLPSANGQKSIPTAGVKNKFSLKEVPYF